MSPGQAAHAETNQGHEEREPDYRFTLANERTFLAWIRTALALLAGGVAVLQVVPVLWPDWAKQVVGVVLTLLAVLIAALAPRRWRLVQQAIRRGLPLPTPRLPLLLAGGILVTAGVVLLIEVVM
ncbi:MAG: DUF202 domain-containing protein [Streptosporangiales bacterium]|nr:DUF202 domain-containing protein [Streptosporangiales bacterium]